MLACRFARAVLRRPHPSRQFTQARAAGLSSTACRRSYDDTIPNLEVKLGARVIVQGFTGRQSTFDSEHSLDFGTNIVGGVRPGKEGEHLGRPYFPTVQAAKDHLNPDATLVYVAAGQAAGAIEDAVAAEIPLIVAVAEHIPLHDMYRIQSILRSQSKSRLVGANSPGMTSMHAKCRLGFQPLPFFKPGCVSIVAKSGTLSYEAIASTTEAGLGQSYAIGIGGDDLPGTSFVDALTVFERDEHTEGMIVIGEIGGSLELQAADWIKDYRRRTAQPKPILTLLGGVQEVPQKVMGHDGAMRSYHDDLRTDSKLRRLRDAGAQVVRHPSYFGPAMKEALAAHRSSKSANPSQRRSLHTAARRRPTYASTPTLPFSSLQSSRSYQISASATRDLLKPLIPVPVTTQPLKTLFELVIEPRRESYKPCIHIRSHQRPDDAKGLFEGTLLFDAGLPSTEADSRLSNLVDGFTAPEAETTDALRATVTALVSLYREREGKRFVAQLGTAEGESGLALSAQLDFDDWAFQMAKRQGATHELERDEGVHNAIEMEAAQHNIVYLKRDTPSATVGTIVNGAGLAMNTVDNLQAWGLPAANFLDTGGKATTTTVGASFRAVLADERVRVVFVNIFGGLTKCEMIAEGILMAFKEVGVRVPVVVRLRGTNEAEGQKVLQQGAKDMGLAEIQPGAAAGDGTGSLGMTAVRGFDEAMREIAKALGAEARAPWKDDE